MWTRTGCVSDQVRGVRDVCPGVSHGRRLVVQEHKRPDLRNRPGQVHRMRKVCRCVPYPGKGSSRYAYHTRLGYGAGAQRPDLLRTVGRRGYLFRRRTLDAAGVPAGAPETVQGGRPTHRSGHIRLRSMGLAGTNSAFDRPVPVRHQTHGLY